LSVRNKHWLPVTLGPAARASRLASDRTAPRVLRRLYRLLRLVLEFARIIARQIGGTTGVQGYPLRLGELPLCPEGIGVHPIRPVRALDVTTPPTSLGW
jgi:hypothetical protein